MSTDEFLVVHWSRPEGEINVYFGSFQIFKNCIVILALLNKYWKDNLNDNYSLILLLKLPVSIIWANNWTPSNGSVSGNGSSLESSCKHSCAIWIEEVILLNILSTKQPKKYKCHLNLNVLPPKSITKNRVLEPKLWVV